jgi:hypothetical protein
VTSGFGRLALVLTSIGVYGVMAAGVSRRVNKIRVRMALGARADQVLRMVFGEPNQLGTRHCVRQTHAKWSDSNFDVVWEVKKSITSGFWMRQRTDMRSEGGLWLRWV